MFKIHLANASHDLIPDQFKLLAERTNGYSGSDIAQAVKEAMMICIREVQSATHFKKVR